MSVPPAPSGRRRDESQCTEPLPKAALGLPCRPRGEAVKLAGVSIGRGERVTVDLPLPQLYTHTPLTLPVHVVRGQRDGPRLFVSAAVHGDAAVVKRFSGHLSVQMVLRYTHPSDDRVDQALDSLSGRAPTGNVVAMGAGAGGNRS